MVEADSRRPHVLDDTATPPGGTLRVHVHPLPGPCTACGGQLAHHAIDPCAICRALGLATTTT